ncbi:hypothetical protein DPMN_049442, partial [Dreissena polymorpha]
NYTEPDDNEEVSQQCNSEDVLRAASTTATEYDVMDNGDHDETAKQENSKDEVSAETCTDSKDKRTFRRHRKRSRDQTIHHRRGVPYLPSPHFYIMTPAFTF